MRDEFLAIRLIDVHVAWWNVLYRTQRMFMVSDTLMELLVVYWWWCFALENYQVQFCTSFASVCSVLCPVFACVLSACLVVLLVACWFLSTCDWLLWIARSQFHHDFLGTLKFKCWSAHILECMCLALKSFIMWFTICWLWYLNCLWFAWIPRVLC